MAAGSISDRISGRQASDLGGHGLPDAAGRLVFSAAGRDYRWSDVIAAARVHGDWAVLQDRVSASPVAADEGSVSEWRRRRGLLSADETVAWLDRWGLDLSDVRRHVGQEDALQPPLAGDGLDRAAWAEAVCSGALNRLAWGLAAPVAVTADPPGGGSSLDARVFARLTAEFARWREGIESSDAVSSLIEANAAGWASVVTQALTFSDLDAAREAVLCARLDGLSFPQVAELSGGELVELRGMLDDLDEPLRALVASAVPDELLGPVAEAGAYRVLWLVAKASPDPGDPVVLARARELAVAHAIDHATAAKIVWHDHL